MQVAVHEELDIFEVLSIEINRQIRHNVNRSVDHQLHGPPKFLEFDVEEVTRVVWKLDGSLPTDRSGWLVRQLEAEVVDTARVVCLFYLDFSLEDRQSDPETKVDDIVRNVEWIFQRNRQLVELAHQYGLCCLLPGDDLIIELIATEQLCRVDSDRCGAEQESLC